jgi:hypothetical protein
MATKTTYRAASGLLSQGSAGAGQLTSTELAALQPQLATSIPIAANYTFVAGDDGKNFHVTAAGITLTVPAGLAWAKGGAYVQMPPTGQVTFAATGGSTMNGATTPTARDRTSNPGGVLLWPNFAEVNSYGLTNGAAEPSLVTVTTATYTPPTSSTFIEVDSTTQAVVVTLPADCPTMTQYNVLWKAGANAVTIQSSAASRLLVLDNGTASISFVVPTLGDSTHYYASGNRFQQY